MIQILQVIAFLTCIATVMCCRGGVILDSGVTLQERAIILEAHNRLRAKVAMGRVPGQPGAENMREMVWDEELAAKAQEWANQCTFQHDPRRVIPRFTMGQNMAIIWSTAPLAENYGDFPSRIQNWFNEVQRYAFGSGWTPKTGHYSQLVWGETNLVGCGYTYYKDARRYNKLYVCNYGPGGNVVGYMPYATGTPSCSNHGMYPSSKYQGLCTKTESSSSFGTQQNSIDSYYKSYNTYKSTYPTKYQQPQPQQKYYQQEKESQYYQQEQQPKEQPQEKNYQEQQQHNGYYSYKDNSNTNNNYNNNNNNNYNSNSYYQNSISNNDHPVRTYFTSTDNNKSYKSSYLQHTRNGFVFRSSNWSP